MAKFSDKDNDPLAGERLQRHIDRALAVEPPADPEQSVTYRLVKRLYRPLLSGTDNIPDRPCLFIGNHSLFALDAAILQPVMHAELGIFARAMGDKFLFVNDAMGDFVLDHGSVMGHPEVCSALMEAGEDILVFPGGAHEAVKPAREMYRLQWKERYGFVRLAAWHGYTIVPFGMVGPDEFYDHLIEGEELPDSALAPLLRRLGLLTEDTRPDMMPPIPLGALGTFFPKPQRCFVGFGKPVDLSDLVGQRLSKSRLKSIRAQVAVQIEEQLAEQLLLREQRRGEDGLLRRILTL